MIEFQMVSEKWQMLFVEWRMWREAKEASMDQLMKDLYVR